MMMRKVVVLSDKAADVLGYNNPLPNKMRIPFSLETHLLMPSCNQEGHASKYIHIISLKNTII